MLPSEIFDEVQETLKPPAPLARLERYYYLAATDHVLEYTMHPMQSFERFKELEPKAGSDHVIDQAIFAVMFASFSAIAFGAMVGQAGPVGLEILAPIVLALLAVLPLVYSLSKRKNVRAKDGTRFIQMEPAMKEAWTDWNTAMAKIQHLDPHSDALQTLLVQDAVLRPALTAYLTDEDLSPTERKRFETWFYTVCSDATELERAEIERAEAYSLYEGSNAIAAALHSPNELSAATTHSRVLTDTVKDVLGDRG